MYNTSSKQTPYVSGTEPVAVQKGLGEGEMVLPPSKRDLSNKKRRGIFYTPDEASQLLVKWGIRTPEDVILEPSFGGCGFLEASLERLEALGCDNAHQYLLGCDIDPKAFENLAELLETTPDPARFKEEDFLRVVPGDFNQLADAIIGNPPYVSWHNMLPQQRKATASIKRDAGNHLNNKGSLWTFFIAHSLKFLRRGGRVAWILPGSFVYADYAVEVRNLIAKSFRHSTAIMLAQRLFLEEGTEESTVILLAEDFQPEQDQGTPMRFAAAAELEQAALIIEEWKVNKESGLAWDKHINRLLLPTSIMQVYDQLQVSWSCKELGEIAKIRIGLVTGDNSFFVMTRKKADEYELSAKMLRPIIARQAHIKGLQVLKNDLVVLEQEDTKCLLLTTTNSRYKSAPLKKLLATYPVEDIEGNRTFAKRNPWYFVAQEATPDAFLSCMNWYGPQLALNTAATTCTNTVYRVEFTNSLEATPEFRQSAAVSLQSTFSQFSAELYGRSYGSGALKLEPSEAKRIALLLPPSGKAGDAAFQLVDDLLREGKAVEARKAADKFLIEQGVLTLEAVVALEQGLSILRTLRRGARRPFTDQ